MSFWDKIKNTIRDAGNMTAKFVSRDASRCAFIDVEVGLNDHRSSAISDEGSGG